MSVSPAPSETAAAPAATPVAPPGNTSATPRGSGAPGEARTGRVCVIGAGSSGIAACQVLHERGISFDCFEKGSQVGGNWRYRNDNGMSAAYRSLFINTSRRIMEFASYPMPESLPDYPHHSQIAAYFDDFVDHFGFRERIRFRTEVTRAEPTPDGDWVVTANDGTTGRYLAVLVANGHHWNPRWPDPPYPGEFDGEQIHAHAYDTPEGHEGKNVLVLGIGNSSVDIACESSRISAMTYLAMRRGAYVLPKYIKGTPTDELAPTVASYMPIAVQRFLYSRLLKTVQGEVEQYGLPTPDHKLLEAHPTVSAELLGRIGHGRIAIKPNIERLEGKNVRFEDGSVEEIDTIIYCTGYKVTFPFLAPEVMNPEHNRVELFKRVVHPDRPGLYFIGLVQPLGAIMPLSELQSNWVADLIEGRAKLPPVERMKRDIARSLKRMHRRYVKSDRHTIQVDFYPYIRELKRERRRRR